MACADVPQIFREFTEPRPRPARLPLELASGAYLAKAVSGPLVRQVGPDLEEDYLPRFGLSGCSPRSPRKEKPPDHAADEGTAKCLNHA